jgi:predicted Zn-dependent protease
MYAAGYDPNAMATMFEKLEAKNKKTWADIESLCHASCATGERAAALALAARFPSATST